MGSCPGQGWLGPRRAASAAQHQPLVSQLASQPAGGSPRGDCAFCGEKPHLPPQSSLMPSVRARVEFEECALSLGCHGNHLSRPPCSHLRNGGDMIRAPPPPPKSSLRLQMGAMAPRGQVTMCGDIWERVVLPTGPRCPGGEATSSPHPHHDFGRERAPSKNP